MDNYISVSILNEFVHNVICAEDFLRYVCVCGEVENFKIVKGNAYFVLKDDKASLNCSCFGISKTYIPKDGEKVILNGGIDFYVKMGKLSFIARTITPLGKGLLAMQFEMLKKKLLEEGLFDESHKVAIPQFCSRVCVITSKTGAVIRDIVRTVRNKNSLIDIVVYDVKVQGDKSADEICTALDTVDKLGFDCIIIARGGGSIEDLSPFNSEKLVRAVYNCKTPIISAVGHETDITLCDIVSDFRCATPTAAAEKIAYPQQSLIDYLVNFKDNLLISFFNILQNNRLTLIRHMSNLNTSFEGIVKANSSRLQLECNNLEHSMAKFMLSREQRLAELTASFNANNPTNILTKGYFALYKQGESIKSLDKLTVGDDIEILGENSRAKAKITEVK